MGESGGLNLYGFVGNDSINYIDLLGEKGWPTFIACYLGIPEQEVNAILESDYEKLPRDQQKEMQRKVRKKYKKQLKKLTKSQQQKFIKEIVKVEAKELALQKLKNKVTKKAGVKAGTKLAGAVGGAFTTAGVLTIISGLGTAADVCELLKCMWKSL